MGFKLQQNTWGRPVYFSSARLNLKPILRYVYCAQTQTTHEISYLTLRAQITQWLNAIYDLALVVCQWAVAASRDSAYKSKGERQIDLWERYLH